ncbi:MAG: Mg-protoporphyrin monomethyl ester oxidative cyclase, partial [Pseudobdellovibrio sp.]|nr:Mg-protoporphyrin monomethyl ester oxidative cyclase [Pseudobdellovibrio sp.]
MSSKSDILLCTLNSTYQHSSFGLRYLLANLGELQSRTQILESTIKENPRTLVEKILARSPRIVGFSVYIWNTSETLETIMVLKKVSPETIIVLGGPEISYETKSQPHLQWADYVIQGEADFSFRELCLEILNQAPAGSEDRNSKVTVTFGGTAAARIIPAALPDIKQIQMPYSLYSDDDIKNRVIYVEASRGCPYKCEYCLSSLDKSVRSFDLDLFLAEMKTLMDRGARTFKFVDRTFNLSPTTSTRILKFFLEHIDLGLFLHFELVPDRLPLEIRELITQFPAGSLQFEIGIQTLNP